MNIITFNDLNLYPGIARALAEMGFEKPTEIQSKVIPLIREGMDVIGRSQTGTGKTMAFAIPAIETILFGENIRTLAQILVLCPTRELTQQACAEIKKITKYIQNIKVAEVYGGAPMMKQITQLKTANIVVGTPGRIMDHMRRRTLKLGNLRMVVLDEADEMLSMGFKEDIETILVDTPKDIQTVLFSATMPRPIMELTKKIQKDPILVEINKAQVTIDKISQMYVDVPMGRKTDALALLLKYYSPAKAVLFCNTKKMVDDIVAKLLEYNFSVQGLHGDMKQSQRTQVMDSFKMGNINILVATDVAARGIDVKDVDYVINYDIPQTNEYYVHRIGRTGRAGREGCAITVCSGRRQVALFKQILRETKSQAKEIAVPTVGEIKEKCFQSEISTLKEMLSQEVEEEYTKIVDDILSKNISLYKLAANLMKTQLKGYGKDLEKFEEIGAFKSNLQVSSSKQGYKKLLFNIGRSCRIAPNHLVGAIAERMDIPGAVIGKIEIYDSCSAVELPEDLAYEAAEMMTGTKICGKYVEAKVMPEAKGESKRIGDNVPGGRLSKSKKEEKSRKNNKTKLLHYQREISQGKKSKKKKN